LPDHLDLCRNALAVGLSSQPACLTDLGSLTSLNLLMKPRHLSVAFRKSRGERSRLFFILEETGMAGGLKRRSVAVSRARSTRKRLGTEAQLQQVLGLVHLLGRIQTHPQKMVYSFITAIVLEVPRPK